MHSCSKIGEVVRSIEVDPLSSDGSREGADVDVDVLSIKEDLMEACVSERSVEYLDSASFLP
jgi:hypothetical protein